MPIPRLVVFELHHLGDALMALPFLHGARRKFAVTVVCRPPVAELLRACIGFLDITDAAPDWVDRALQAQKFGLGPQDAAACVWADARAHLLMAFTGAGRRVGFPMTPRNYYASEIPWRRRRMVAGRILAETADLFYPLLTDSLTRHDAAQHHMEDWKQIGETLGSEWKEATPWIEATPHPTPEMTAFLREQQGRRLVLIHPGGRLPEKRWPHFEELLARLAGESDLSVMVAEPPGEPFPKTTGPHQRTFPTNTWREVFALFAAADAVVCNDSAASHLAVAWGKPVVAIFGSGSPDWFAPWKNRHLAAVPEGRVLYPLIDHGAPPGSVHLDSLPVELVESRLRTALNAG